MLAAAAPKSAPFHSLASHSLASHSLPSHSLPSHSLPSHSPPSHFPPGVEKLGNKKLEDASELLSESISASRAVAAFGLQPRTAKGYGSALREVNRKASRSILMVAFGQSFERVILQATYAIAFLAGGYFLRQGQITFGELINTFLAVTLSAEQMGRITGSAPDIAKAVRTHARPAARPYAQRTPVPPLLTPTRSISPRRPCLLSSHPKPTRFAPPIAPPIAPPRQWLQANAAEQIFRVIDAGAASSIDPLSDSGVKHGASGGGGAAGLRIEFRGVCFAYPSRPDAPVLSDFSLVIEPGQYVGIVGQSGSGKSTLALLVGRVYDVDKGEVLVDGTSVLASNA